MRHVVSRQRPERRADHHAPHRVELRPVTLTSTAFAASGTTAPGASHPITKGTIAAAHAMKARRVHDTKYDSNADELD